MLSRREFMHATGAASLALATPGSDKRAPRRERPEPESTYLGRPARYWLGRLIDRHAVEYRKFDESGESARESIYVALAAFGEPVVPFLRRMLLSGRDQGRREAIKVFSRMGPLGENVLLDAARDPRGNLRADALAALATHFPDCPSLPALLAAALDDDVHEVRLRAAESLWCLGSTAKPILEQALSHADPAVRRCGVQQVIRIDPAREYAEPRLLRLLNDPDLEVRWAAAQELFFHLPVDPTVVPVLLELIHAGCLAAANYLPFAGASGLATTLKLLEDSDVTLRAAVASALSELVCNRDHVPTRNGRELSSTETTDILRACGLAAQDSDLAVQIPARQVVDALEKHLVGMRL